MKPIVLYRTNRNQVIKPGQPALVWPVDHPSPLVSNTTAVLTSPVISIGPMGQFETMNTRYYPEEVMQVE